jgi:hypothetical protein
VVERAQAIAPPPSSGAERAGVGAHLRGLTDMVASIDPRPTEGGRARRIRCVRRDMGDAR